MPAHDSPIIQISHLKKEFSTGNTPVTAVSDISLAIAPGEIFGLLGPNGAGKTTTMRMLCTLLTPTSGSIHIDGFDSAQSPNEIRKRIGYVSQKGGMEPDATGRENLILQAQLYGMDIKEAASRASELIERLNLASFADRKPKTFSGGQRRIFDLAAFIIHRPAVLFLDEPTTGLDPQSRAHVWQEVKKLNELGTTVFLTTHYLEEADELCKHVAIVDHGTIISMGTPSDLKAQIANDIIMFGLQTIAEAEQARDILQNQPSIKEVQLIDTVVHLYVDQTGNRDIMLPSLLKLLHQHNMLINTVQLSRPTLDDVFLKLTGRTLRDSEQQ